MEETQEIIPIMDKTECHYFYLNQLFKNKAVLKKSAEMHVMKEKY